MPHTLVADTTSRRAAPVWRAGRAGTMSALVAIASLLALELVRLFPPLLTWAPGEVPGSPGWVGRFVAPSVGAIVAVVVAARREPRAVLVGGALVLAVARIGVQLVDGDGRTVLAGVGLLAALAVLGLLATIGLPLFGGGVIAAVLLDVSLQAMLGTRPLAWSRSPWALVLVALVVTWMLVLVATRARRDVFVLGRSPRAAIPLVLIGPVLVVEAFVLGSIGWVAHTIDAGWVVASLVIGIGAVAGLAAAAVTARVPDGPWVWVAVTGGAALVILGLSHRAPGPWWAVLIVAAQAGVGSSLTAAVARGPGTGSRRWTAASMAAGLFVMLGLLATLDGRGMLGAPVGPGSTLAWVGLAVVAATAISRAELSPRPHRPGWAEVRSLLAVFVVPAALVVAGAPALVGSRAAGAAAPVDELRVVTYNVALAFDSHGELNLDGVAAVLRSVDADVVGLQEVPRGHLPAGGVDMVGWLQRELDLPYRAFQPATPGALHGNAVLSRHPIRSVDTRDFQRRGTSLGRGALAVDLAVPGGEVRLITAHLPPGGTLGQRADRVGALLELWGGRARTIVAADLNAQPGSDVVTRLAEAGLTDSWASEVGEGFTYPASDPRARIDWVLLSPDLGTISTEVLESTASDHRPVLAVVDLGG